MAYSNQDFQAVAYVVSRALGGEPKKTVEPRNIDEAVMQLDAVFGN